MRRVAVVVIVALLNALVFGIRGSAAESAQSDEQARPAEIFNQASKIGPGKVIHIVYLDGTQIDAILERVLPDSVEILLVTADSKVPATVPMATIKSIEEVKGKAKRSFLKTAGVTLLVLTGVCLGLSWVAPAPKADGTKGA